MIKFAEDYILTSGKRSAVLYKFHLENMELFYTSKGSSSNHQAYYGGYFAHIWDCFKIADIMYSAFKAEDRTLPSWEEIIFVLYFHDIEKLWKYTTGLPENWDKLNFLSKELVEKYKIVLTDEEIHAIIYIHGEGDSYSSQKRIMSPLCAFCHAVDTLSARVWHGMEANEAAR